MDKKYTWTDPKNPIWLNIARKYVIISSFFFAFSGLMFGIIQLEEGFGGAFVVAMLLAGGIVGFVNYVFGMLGLNLLYNVQQIRINTEKSLD